MSQSVQKLRDALVKLGLDDELAKLVHKGLDNMPEQMADPLWADLEKALSRLPSLVELIDESNRIDAKISAQNFTAQPTYDPTRLLNALMTKLNLRGDVALSRALEVPLPTIRKIRIRRLPVGNALLVRMHEVSGMSIKELRELMGARERTSRLGLNEEHARKLKLLRQKKQFKEFKQKIHDMENAHWTGHG